MLHREIGRFIVRTTLLSFPLIALILAYLVWDPFLVLRRHSQFYPGAVGVSPNRDYVSTELLRAQASVARYDSFIFGNSRSNAFETAAWARHLPRGSRPFHYDASLESLYGVWAKVRYLDRNGYTIQNAILIVDADLLGRGSNIERRALYRKHPALSGDGWWEFHVSCFEAFLSRQFFIAYADHRLFGHWRPYMAGTLDRRTMIHDPQTNDLMFTPLENEISRSADDYYHRHAAIFDSPGPLVGTPNPRVIGSAERGRLADIARVFQAHGSDVRVVVSPLFDRRALSSADRQILAETFGVDRVHDYSGTNDITLNRFNYYETSHYRVGIANRILKDVYEPSLGHFPGGQ